MNINNYSIYKCNTNRCRISHVSCYASFVVLKVFIKMMRSILWNRICTDTSNHELLHKGKKISS